MGFFRESWHLCRAPRWGMCALLLCLTAACGGRPAPRADAEILVIGDSILAFHSFWGASVGDAVAEQMGVPVENRAVSGARFTSTSARVTARGGDIRRQYVAGDWDWVLLNGGANDLMSECGCQRCTANLDGLISADGRDGEIPRFVRGLTTGGTRVMLLGYYDGNVRPNPFARCQDEIDALNARMARLAARNAGVFYVTAAGAIDPADQRHWYVDRVHPSQLGARRIGARVAQAMAAADNRDGAPTGH
ncbi:SGNH/GDSL hydrolase family protein [Pseudooceanicola lipolyticus]|uniref:SGNH/GDSL hydrolase family protein n=1 Tax=Pseudooceanicola lipolyticus TaxID=2029104 RepID=A0A2M8J2Y5_9RHOB|nr:SGNH/GDSL hydrolase family protein [Pseudooceanicola lipolyticus]PJE37142.1 SGNH/GDSL hydrolase family protein [Pseudooceanicola lipolyticus]